MQQAIINAAPGVVQYGTRDLSQVTIPRTIAAIPQHIPKFFFWGKKGPVTEQLAVGADLVNYYGADTFDLRKKYANHTTPFINGVNAAANLMMLKRLTPPDANPAATLVLCLDVLPVTLPVYQRNPDGSFVLTPAGAKIPTAATVLGSSVQWVVINRMSVPGGALLQPGQLTSAMVTGLVPPRVNATTLATSVMHPIFEFDTSSFGAWGNDVGIRMWAPTAATTQMPSTLMASERVYPINFAMVERITPTTAPVIKFTQTGDSSLMAVVKPGTIDPTTDAQMYVGDKLLNAYRNIKDSRYPIDYGNFGGLAIYQNNIDTLLTTFHAAESALNTAGGDFTTAVTDRYMFNFVGGTSSQNVAYDSYQIVDTANSVRPGVYTNIMASGGTDGTMNDAVHASLVEVEMARYLDPLDPIQEITEHVESHIYDTGFPVTTKRALCNIIGLRKDTMVILGTHVVGQPNMTAAEEESLAIMLRTRLQLFPESDFFGTPVMRGIIMGRSALITSSQWAGRLPMTYELAVKSARYMGAGNGMWKADYSFDEAPGSIVTEMYDISITNVPMTVRNRNWDAGLNWVQRFDHQSFFFPALKTVYAGDTSVLNSYLTVCAIGYLNKIANAAHRQFTGGSRKTEPQLAKAVDDFVTAAVKDKFDNRFIIQPATFFTAADTASGYRWTLPIKLFAPNMKTVMTTYLEAYRLSAATPVA